MDVRKVRAVLYQESKVVKGARNRKVAVGFHYHLPVLGGLVLEIGGPGVVWYYEAPTASFADVLGITII